MPTTELNKSIQKIALWLLMLVLGGTISFMTFSFRAGERNHQVIENKANIEKLEINTKELYKAKVDKTQYDRDSDRLVKVLDRLEQKIDKIILKD